MQNLETIIQALAIEYVRKNTEPGQAAATYANLYNRAYKQIKDEFQKHPSA